MNTKQYQLFEEAEKARQDNSSHSDSLKGMRQVLTATVSSIAEDYSYCIRSS